MTTWLTGCTGNATCVEVADIGNAIVLRSSNHTDHIALIDRDEFAAFIDAVKAGEFDQLATDPQQQSHDGS